MEPVQADVPAGKVVIFTAGGQEFGVEIMAVREIRGWTRETPLPQAPAYIRGVINLRGAVLPIADLSAMLNLAPCTPSARHVIIVVGHGRRFLGLLVDAVCDILPVQDALIKSAELTGEHFIVGLLSVEERLVAILATDQLFETRARAA